MLIEQVNLENGYALGLKLDMGQAPLLVIRANKLGDVAVRVTGVKSFEDVLNAKAVDVSEAAKKLGITVGMTGKEALNKMF